MDFSNINLNEQDKLFNYDNLKEDDFRTIKDNIKNTHFIYNYLAL